MEREENYEKIGSYRCQGMITVFFRTVIFMITNNIKYDAKSQNVWKLLLYGIECQKPFVLNRRDNGKGSVALLFSYRVGTDHTPPGK